MRALVIVDAWENYRSNIQIPTVNSEAHSFGGFLNEVCKLERKQGTLIIHSYGENIPMEQIEIRPEDWILDSPKNLKKGVKLINKLYKTEASGGIKLNNVRKIASTGVKRISVGQITHSAPAINFKLEI